MNRVPRHIYSQIVGTTGDTCPSIWIFYQDSRYIINCGEGFQRFSVQYGLRLSKLRGIFLTDLTWESIGGLPGSILTLSDIPSLSFEQPLQLFGPRNTSNWFKSCKPFLNRPKFNLSIEEFDHSHSNTECFKDENVTVRPIIIQSPRIKNTSERAHKKCLDVCCYAFHTPSFRGKFDPKKAQLHKVPKGPAYSQLTRGESVTSSDGILIHPHDVISPDIPGSVVLIIKCPSEEYLPSLTESSTWKDYQNGEFSQNISVMYHITPAKIMNHPKYESWIKTFATNTQHIAINENCSARTTFDSAAHNHFCMNTIDKEMFPELYEDTYTPSTPEHFLQGDIKTKFHIYPVQDPPMEVYPWHLDEEPLVRKIPIQFNAPESPCNIEQKNPVHALQKWDDTDITFLGTGSSCPGKYRNVSAIHLTTENGKHGILMDAGEGTLGQMFRVYGRKLQEIIKALKFIFITHIHADHHLGLNRIVQYRNTLLQGENESTAPLYIVAPESVISWLGPYYDMIDNSCHLLRLNDIAKINTILDDYNLQFQPVPVVHCNDAYGFVFRHRSGWKLVYSGDTRPCNRLIEEGRDADLLIHEATFEDGMEEDAKAKRHCTVGEAIWVGQRMNAKSIVLTHFSQRYPKVPVLAPEISSKIGIAFDFMRLKFSWVSRFGRVFPIISKLFSDLEAEKEKEKEMEADMLAKAKLSKRKSVPPRNDHDIPVTKKSRVASK